MRLNVIALGKRIRILRKKRGYSQSELSEIIDKSPTYMSYIENGVKYMSLDTFVDVTNALNASADELLKDSLDNTVVVLNQEFAKVIVDCSIREQRILLDLLIALKQSLRDNLSH